MKRLARLPISPISARLLPASASGLGHADIAAVCVLRFLHEAHPGLVEDRRFPALSTHAARCEALPPFREIAQPLVPPS